MTNKAKITNLLLTVNGHIRNSSLAMVIHDISEPICDPASEEDSTLLHREEMRRQHLEDSIQLLDHGERALRKDENRRRILEPSLQSRAKPGIPYVSKNTSPRFA